MPDPYNPPVALEMPINKSREPLYTKSAQDKELAMVMQLWKQARQARSKYDQNWDRYEKYYEGKQWVKSKRPAFRSSPVANMAYPTIETVVPIMTDTSPGFDVLPQEPSDFEFAAMLSEERKNWWERQSMGHVITETLQDACIYGIGILKIIWDPDALEGRGDIIVRPIDPRNIWVPQNAQDFNRRCPYVIEEYESTVGEAKKRWPKHADKIRGTRNQKSSDTEYNGEFVVVSPVDKDEGLEQPDYLQMNEECQTVKILEVWMDDNAEEEYLLENGEKGKKLKYPRGKVIWIIPDLKLHLETSDRPYMHGQKPYVRIVDNLRARKFYARGEIEPVEHTQDLINKALSKIYDWLNMVINPVWVIDIESGVDANMITNQIGAIIPKRQGTTVDRKEAPSMPPQVFEFYRMMVSLHDTQTGIHDVTQGRRPTGITAAEAIQDLQEAAQTRIRLKERNMQVSLQQLGYLWTQLVMQFYTRPRMVRVTGKDGWPEYFEFYIKDNIPNTRMFKQNFDHKGYTKSEWAEHPQTKGIFDIQVVAGTSLPFMKAKRGRLAMDLFDRGAIDQKSLLDTVEWHEKEQVMGRMLNQQGAQTQGGPQQHLPSPPTSGV